MGHVKYNWSSFIRKVEQDLEQKAIQLADEAVEISRSLCPVDTGDLQSTIRAEITTTQQPRWINISLKAGGPAASGKDVNYASYVEYGDNPQGLEQPFIRPGWNHIQNNVSRFRPNPT